MWLRAYGRDLGQCALQPSIKQPEPRETQMHARNASTLALALAATGLLSLAAVLTPVRAQTPSLQEFKYCKADVERLCKGIRPGEGRLLKCLKTHEDSLSVGCAKELKALKTETGK
jgi:hypothetical protein